MDGLLKSVLDAHGGLASWAKTTKITARISLGGPSWAARGWPDVYSNQAVTIDPHREQVTFAPFTAPDRMSVLEVGPERVAITTLDGRIVEERLNPRGSFPTAFDATEHALGCDPGGVLHECGAPAITVRTITLDGDADGVVPATDGKATAAKFVGGRQHRVIPRVGHNLPQQDPPAFAAAVWELASETDRVAVAR
jgi:pimeloyl-ACP methyl ester carboxylesterase